MNEGIPAEDDYKLRFGPAQPSAQPAFPAPLPFPRPAPEPPVRYVIRGASPQPEPRDWFKVATIALLAIILALLVIIALTPRTTTVELSPTLNTSVNPSFSTSNSFSPNLTSNFNASINYTMANATIQPTGNISWVVNNITLVQQIQNITSISNITIYACNATNFYANGTNATPCRPTA